jgi:pyruvate dehydrogenase E1 component alpha subunit
MLLIRQFEEKIIELYPSDAIKSPVHLSIGQEAIAAGVCCALRPDDYISNTYRCHATYIAKGGDLNAMMAELYGKRDGCAGGKAGSMHLIDINNGILGASAVVGTTIPVATGYALALQRKAKKTGKQQITVAMFGDGATEEGCFYESLNFAAIHKLPIIYICENNRLAIHSPLSTRWATDKLCERVETYGIKTRRILDGDVFKIYEAIKEEADNLRLGKANGPVFFELMTYRWLEHVGITDDHYEEYRDETEYQKWVENDQIARLAKMLPESTRMGIEQEVKSLITQADQFAQNSPYPYPEELHAHVYA